MIPESYARDHYYIDVDQKFRPRRETKHESDAGKNGGAEKTGLTDAEPKFLVRQEKPAVRCEICHQVDLFNPETGHCARCVQVMPPSLPEYPQPVQEEVIQVPPPRPSNRRSGPVLAFGIAILMYGMVQVFGLIREMIPPAWVERFAKTVLDPQVLVFIGMAVVLAMTGRKASCRRRQKLANRENV